MLLMGKLTISMAIFNSFLYVYQRVIINQQGFWTLLNWSMIPLTMVKSVQPLNLPRPQVAWRTWRGVADVLGLARK